MQLAVAQPQPRTANGFLKRLKGSSAVGRIGVILLVALIWEVCARAFIDPKFVSPPTVILYTLFDTTLADPQIRAAIYLTFYELAVAFAMSVVFGVFAGLLIGLNQTTYKGLYPLILLLWAIPQVTILPLFILYFGLGPAGKIAFGFSHGIFPIMMNVIAGVRNVNPIFIASAKSMGASERQILWRIVFPHMIPSFFTGMRLGMTLTLLGVVLAELYVSTAGIGYFTQLYAETFDPAPLFALIFLLATCAVILNETLRRAEVHFGRWRQH
jgi:ABC-type nitrate/sulfonate/bicarbonate transport system permease component